jgi:fructan beta-fructosidase
MLPHTPSQLGALWKIRPLHSTHRRYNHLPPGQSPVLLGWANNWSYANDIPTKPWKSMMALPRQLSLKKIGNNWILYQQPLPAMHGLRGKLWQAANTNVSNEKKLPVHTQQCEIEMEWQPAANTFSGIYLAGGKHNKLVIGYDAKEQNLYMDRKSAGNISFNKNFSQLSRYDNKISLKNKKLKLRIFFDHSIVEVFVNDGESVMTMQIFPEETDDEITLFSEGAANLFGNVKIWDIRSAW